MSPRLASRPITSQEIHSRFRGGKNLIHMTPCSDMSFTVVSAPQLNLDYRQIIIPRAKLVGDGSCADFMTLGEGSQMRLGWMGRAERQ